MYTEGIRKIFEHQGVYESIEELAGVAAKLHYTAFTFNGEVYARAHNASNWIKTPFTLEDFKCT